MLMLNDRTFCFVDKETRLLTGESQNTKISDLVFNECFFDPLLSVQFAPGRPESHCNITQFALQSHPKN